MNILNKYMVDVFGEENMFPVTKPHTSFKTSRLNLNPHIDPYDLTPSFSVKSLTD